jgi:hypothetical protein
VLKHKPKLRNNLPKTPEPLIVQQQQLPLDRVNLTLSNPTDRVRLPLSEAIDYDKLNPTKQAQWDMGVYGTIELKKLKGFYYYYLRWIDPTTKKRRSTYLGKYWEQAVRKMHKLTA